MVFKKDTIIQRMTRPEDGVINGGIKREDIPEDEIAKIGSEDFNKHIKLFAEGFSMTESEVLKLAKEGHVFFTIEHSNIDEIASNAIHESLQKAIKAEHDALPRIKKITEYILDKFWNSIYAVKHFVFPEPEIIYKYFDSDEVVPYADVKKIIKTW